MGVSTETILHWRSKTDSRTEPNLMVTAAALQKQIDSLVKKCKIFQPQGNKTVLL